MSDLLETKAGPKTTIHHVEASSPEQARKMVGASPTAECTYDMPGRYNTKVYAVKVTGGN